KALSDAAASASTKDAARYFRLPIDRAFAMKGFGSVVTGTLISGSVAPGDEVELLDRKSTRLNSSHVSISYAVFCLKKKNENINIVDGHHALRQHVAVPDLQLFLCFFLLRRLPIFLLYFHLLQSV